MEPLGAVLTQLSKGGGAKGINIEDVTQQLEALTKDYPFQVTPAHPIGSQPPRRHPVVGKHMPVQALGHRS